MVPAHRANLAKKENLYSRGFRWTTLAGLPFAEACSGSSRESLSRLLVPDAATLLNLVGAVMLAGGLFHAILKKHPLKVANRVRAFLTGATLAYLLSWTACCFGR